MQHIILCSDNPVVREAIAGHIADSGGRLTVCESGMELLAAVTTLVADVVVLDLGTHGLSGLLLISAVQELAPDLPILAVSATGDVDARPILQRGIPHVALTTATQGELRAVVAQLAGVVTPSSAPVAVERGALDAVHHAA